MGSASLGSGWGTRGWWAGAVLAGALAVTTEVRADCTSDTDCRAGRTCNEAGRCVARPCTKDVECPSGGICEDGACKVSAPTRPPRAVVAPPPPLAEPTYRTETSGVPGLYVTGLTTLSATWLVTIGVTAGVSSDRDRGFAVGLASIPVVGPWALLGSDLRTQDYTTPIVLAGVLQGTGLLMTILGFSIRRSHRVLVAGELVPTTNGAMLVGTF